MKKIMLAGVLSIISSSAFSATVSCNGVVDSIQVNSNGTLSLGLNTAFDGVTVAAGASQNALEVALYSLQNSVSVNIRSFSDSNDTRCRDNNESLSFRSIRLTD
ncbi:hypothetical protein [Marinicella sp. W31]|uniref:hypothetical protein n=1 Tax=Marinicella sp. W31 TaxID=3023713 RepID=UPI0037572ECD